MNKKLTEIQKQAQKVCEDSVQLILSRTELRNDTKLRCEAINKVCEELVRENKRLTVRNIIEKLNAKFKSCALSESSIRNNTPSGRSYRDIVAAWAIYQLAIGSHKKGKVVVDDGDDIADTVIASIGDEQLRLRVLGLRTTLRNAKRQLQMLQAIAPKKLIYHSADIGINETSKEKESAELSESERDALTALLDPIEIAVNGLKWSSAGQLQSESDVLLSRPGLKQAIEKVLRIKPG